VRTTTCPTYCRRIHDEQPGEVVAHETEQLFIEQLHGGPLRLQMSQDNDNPQPRLHLDRFDFDLRGAETVLAEITLQVQLMREAQARIDAGLVTQ
jgi:hypothetical protein